MERPRISRGWDNFLARRFPRGLSSRGRGGCDNGNLDDGAKGSTSNLELRASR